MQAISVRRTDLHRSGLAASVALIALTIVLLVVAIASTGGARSSVGAPVQPATFAGQSDRSMEQADSNASTLAGDPDRATHGLLP